MQPSLEPSAVRRPIPKAPFILLSKCLADKSPSRFPNGVPIGIDVSLQSFPTHRQGTVAIHFGFEARGGLSRYVMGAFELTYFVTALHRTVGDRDALSAVWAWASGCHLSSVFGEGVAEWVAGQLWHVNRGDLLTFKFRAMGEETKKFCTRGFSSEISGTVCWRPC
jgi:hypothetical protein